MFFTCNPRPISLSPDTRTSSRELAESAFVRGTKHSQGGGRKDRPCHRTLQDDLAGRDYRSRGVSVPAVGLRNRLYHGGAQGGSSQAWDGLHDSLPAVARRAGEHSISFVVFAVTLILLALHYNLLRLPIPNLSLTATSWGSHA